MGLRNTLRRYYRRRKENRLTDLLVVILVIVVIQSARVLIQFNQAEISQTVAQTNLSFSAVIATVALASGIYVQARQNKQQTLILQESQWIPMGFFDNESLYFKFTKNRPYSPKILFEMEDESTGWIERKVSGENGGNLWNVGVGGGIIEQNLQTDETTFEGVLRLRFESTTGCIYEYQYDAVVDTEADNSERIKYSSERRLLPWRDEII